MATFVDSEGREWQVRLTVGALGDVREEAGVDLGAALRSEQGLAELVLGDPAALVKVLWVLVESQSLDKDVDPVRFAHGFDGATLERATEALLAAVADFFPRSRVGKALRENLSAALTRMDDAVLAKLQASSSSPGNSPAPAASTPAT